MSDQEFKYYEPEMTDLDIDRQADAGDYLRQGTCAEVDECDADGKYVPTLRELLAEIRQARTERK